MGSFSLYPLRLRFIAGRAIEIPAGTAANLVRGQFGKILRRQHQEAYKRYFAPVQAEGSGPSGFRDLPRPFVLRTANLEGAKFAAGGRFTIGVNLFETRSPPLALFQQVLTQVARDSLGAAELECVEGADRMDLSLEASGADIRRARIKFLTPTDLKGTASPDFGTLFARVRDRLSLLRGEFGAGPLEIDFRGMGERARAVQLTHSDLQHRSVERRSRSTGLAHSIGGFTGVAEYEGELAEFIPYLKAAQWTGVGRQTVWGKGEILCEAF